MITGNLTLNFNDLKNLANILHLPPWVYPRVGEYMCMQVDQPFYLEFRKDGSIRISTIIEPE